MPAQFTLNGLSPLARRIAVFLHSVSGIVRMDEIRAIARQYSEIERLPLALKQLQESGQAEVCPWCDALLTPACQDQWCRLHKGSGLKIRHTLDCPRAGKAVGGVPGKTMGRRRA